MPSYTVSVTTVDGETSSLTVTWLDDQGQVIVTGQKLVKGGEDAAQRLAPVFAGDLQRNFSDLFPLPPQEPNGGVI